MKETKLPLQNDNGYYEIRIESIGGLGANLCGKMMGELGIKYLGLNSASFSSYGSEKTGTPVKAFIRYSDPDNDIRVHSPVTHPHILCIFHQALMQNTDIFDGCGKDTTIIINTNVSPKDIMEHYITHNNISARKIICIHAQKIAMETKSRINVVMMGAMAKAMGFVKLEDMNEICSNTLGKKYPQALKGNLEGIKRGYEETSSIDCGEISVSEHKRNKESDISQKYKQGTLGYETAPMGGINLNFGNSVVNDLSPSRQGYIPIFIPEKCINCGLCDSTCPDMVFQFEPGEYRGREMMVNKGLDYFHCKGCLRCVSVCPTHALVRDLEENYDRKPYFVPNKDLIRTPDYYEKSGSDGYITSESYLTEKRIEGGEV
ncbi:MAG: 4Fe-4S binding protein [Eubacterium sp.]|nr:4Fe-4S binding protein [Eubacterium sp.]